MKKKRSFFRVIISIIIIAGLLFLVGWILQKNKKSNEEKTAIAAQTVDEIAVKVAEAKPESLDQSFNTNGNFQAWREMEFASENQGRVVRILVKEGSYVRPGQTMAEVDADLLNIDLQNAQSVLQNAQKDQQRFENAFTTGGVTRQQLDQIQLQVDNAKARVEQAKVRIGNANVRSTISAMVNKKYIEPGAFVNPGTPLFQLVDVSSVKLVVNADESQVTQIKTGDKVNITASAFPDKQFEGHVTFIGNKSDAALNFPVEIQVQNTSHNLKAGMYGTAHFRFDNEAPTIVVPRSAFMGSVSSKQVFVVEDGRAHIRNVNPGKIIGDKVEILEGLNDGDKVVIDGQINLLDGSKVSFTE